jgi:hypothetical protein
MTGGKYLIAIAIRLASAIIVPAAFYGGLGVFATGELSTFGSLAGFSIVQLAAPIAALGFLISSFGPTIKRLNTLGIHPVAAFTLPALLAADARVLFMVGGPPAQWSTWEIDVPVFLILGLLVILALGLAREPDADGRNLWQRHGIIGQAVFVWVGLAALIGAVGLAGGIDTGLLPAMTGGFGALLMPEFAADPAQISMDAPPLAFRPLTPIQMFAAGAGAALILLLVKDGFGSPPPAEEREGGGGGYDIDPLKVVLQPLPKTGPTFLRTRGAADLGVAARNPRDSKTFGRRQS